MNTQNIEGMAEAMKADPQLLKTVQDQIVALKFAVKTMRESGVPAHIIKPSRVLLSTYMREYLKVVPPKPKSGCAAYYKWRYDYEPGVAQDQYRRNKKWAENNPINAKLKALRQYSDEIEKVENFEKALADGLDGWECHHRLETHNPDGTPRTAVISEKHLRKRDLYLHRPASELIFLPVAEHKALHVAARKGGAR